MGLRKEAGRLLAIVRCRKIIECFTAGLKSTVKALRRQTDLSRCIITRYKMILKLFSGANLFVGKTIEKSILI